jgi:HK97 family phage portal protein
MGFFDFLERKEEHNEDEVRAYAQTGLRALLDGGTSSTLNEEQVMSIPTVQSIVEIVGGSIAQLPIYLYKEDKEGAIERIYGDIREDILNREPNMLETGYNMKKNMCKDYLLHGVHRIYKEMKRNELVALYSLPTENSTIDEVKYTKGFIVKSYKINVSGEDGDVTFKPEDLIVVSKNSQDIKEPKGAIFYGAELFSLMQEELTYQQSLYKNGAMPIGVIKAQKGLTQGAIDRLRTSWNNLYGGAKNANKTVILEEGMDYQAVGLKPSDLLMTEIKKEHVSEICRLFNVPESLVNAEANKYGSIEQDNISFLQRTLSPILTAIENALNKDLLLEDEKENGYFFQFDTSEILKTTEAEKYEAIKTGMDTGVISLNESRQKLNLKPIKDNFMKWSLGSVLYNPDDGTMMIPNMGIGVPGGESRLPKEEVVKEEVVDNKDKTQNKQEKIQEDAKRE